jgi:hypothetical protein
MFHHTIYPYTCITIPPPSVLTICPLAFQSLITPKKLSATSSGWPALPVVIFFANVSISFAFSSGLWRHSGVSTTPGAMPLTCQTSILTQPEDGYEGLGKMGCRQCW